MLDSVDLGADADSLVKLLEGFNECLETNTGFAGLRHKIAEQLSRAMPSDVDPDNLAIRTVSDPAADLLESVTLFFKEGARFKPLREQSDGLRQLTAMAFFDLAQTSSNIVAIDEPELHLHPTSQATAAELFVRGTNQKVLATHSPYVVQKFDPSVVIVVSPDREFKQLDPSQFSAIDKLRVNWWSPNLLQALTARCVIVVEGAADRVMLQAAAKVLGVGLDQHGVAIFDLDGADKFKHVYGLIGPAGFNLRIMGLVDADRESRWAGVIKARPKDFNSRGFFVAGPDLEGEYAVAFGGPTAAQILVEEGVCREQGVLDACEAPRLGEVSDEALAKFAGSDGRKVLSAAALAKRLTPEIAEKMPSIYGLLQMVREL